MPHTVAASRDDLAHPKTDRRVDPALAALDERLFNPAGWFAIDANNQYVKGMVVPTVEAGVGLIGRGRVAAIVGRLRKEAAVVDVDLGGDFGHWAAHEVAGWMHRQGMWHLLRPSGGADGRFHVFCVHNNRLGELSDYISGLRSELKLRRTDLDLRDAVRPLSSPHRHGAFTRPKGDLRDAERGLRKALPELPEPAPLRKKANTRNPQGAGGYGTGTADVVALFPLPRAGRRMRPEWRRYLFDGIAPQIERADIHSRSELEAGLTLELIWVGLDAKSAWQAIREAHPRAMTKARHQGWRWWVKYVWNPAVEDANTFCTDPTNPDQPTPEVQAAVGAARRRLQDLMWTQTPRARASLLLVGHHLLDRIARTGQLRVPCPERDLVLDTGITDRKTIRKALRLLDGPVGALHTDCLSHSPEQRATTSFEFEIQPSEPQGDHKSPHLASDPPPRMRGLWATLPRSAHATWRALQAAEAPVPLGDLAHRAGLTPGREDEATKSQLRTLKAGLRALAKAGMARVDENGHWYAGTSPRSVRVEERAASTYAEILEQVRAERGAYRARATTSWTRGRAIAAKKEIAKQKAWWASLSVEERETRRNTLSSAFQSLSATDREALKSKLADRRIRAGESEPDHHQAWLDNLSADEFLHRSLDRKHQFRSLSSTERGLLVSSWQRHRARYGLPDPSAPAERVDEFTALPDTSAERDHEFLEHQLNLPATHSAMSDAV